LTFNKSNLKKVTVAHSEETIPKNRMVPCLGTLTDL